MEQKKLKELKEKLKDCYCISDTHFGHLKAFNSYEPIRKEYTKNLGLETLEDFEGIMIDNWNKVVGENSNILHLGDFCIDKRNPNKTIENIKNTTNLLNGYKILIKGNHDKLENSVYYDNGWDLVIDKPVILLDEINVLYNSPKLSHCIITKINDKVIMFSHFGIHQYDKNSKNKYKIPYEYLQKLYKKYNCDFNIHGHSHSSVNHSEVSYNSCVEMNEFTPKLILDILRSS